MCAVHCARVTSLSPKFSKYPRACEKPVYGEWSDLRAIMLEYPAPSV